MPRRALAAPAPSTANAVVRNLCSDTDQNGSDFQSLPVGPSMDHPHTSAIDGVATSPLGGGGNRGDFNLDGVVNSSTAVCAALVCSGGAFSGSACTSHADCYGGTNANDLDIFINCTDGNPRSPYVYNPNSLPAGCTVFKGCDNRIQPDMDRNGTLDMNDFGDWQRCVGATLASAPDCFH